MNRRPALEIGEVKLDLPDWLKQAAANYDPGKLFGMWEYLRDDAGVEVDSLPNTNVLICNAFCDWHEDSGVSEYTGLLILRNDSKSWVETRNANVVKSQPPGTVMLLDTHKYHRLNCPKGAKAPHGVWMAANIEYEGRRRPPFQKVVDNFLKILAGNPQEELVKPRSGLVY